MNFPVAELKQRFNIGKQAEINRRKYLGLVPKKVDGVYVVDEEQLSTLDKLDQFLNSSPKAKMSDFKVGSSGSSEYSQVDYSPARKSVMEATLIDEELEDSSEIVLRGDEPTDFTLLVETIAKTIAPVNPIGHWERLQWLVDHEILVSTSEVQALLGTRPKGDVWQRGSFVFYKVGKLGNQSSWEVTKV